MTTKYCTLPLMAAILGGAMLALSLLASPTTGAAADDEGPFVMKTCTGCHSSRRICSMLGTRDAKGWEATVDRMRRNGLSLDDPGKTGVSAYLAGLGRGSAPLCGN